MYETKHYEVIITDSPTDPSYECYGILNKQTQVVEGYIGQLARAKMHCDQYDKDLTSGIKTDEDYRAELIEKLTAGSFDPGPGGIN